MHKGKRQRRLKSNISKETFHLAKLFLKNSPNNDLKLVAIGDGFKTKYLFIKLTIKFIAILSLQ